MKSIVIGDTGFIGKNVVAGLRKAGDEILGISKSDNGPDNHKRFDLINGDFSELRSILQSFKPDRLYHFGSYPVVKNNDFSSSYDMLVTHKLLDAVDKNCHFILGSSIAVYGSAEQGKIFDVNDIPNPLSTYALNKVASEKLLYLYKNIYSKIKYYTIARLCGHVGDMQKGVIADIIKKIKFTETIDLLGDAPGSKKPYIHINDSVNCLINLSPDFVVANICPNDNISVLKIAEILKEKYACQKNVNWLGNEANWSGDGKNIAVKSSFPTTIRNSQQAIKEFDYEKN